MPPGQAPETCGRTGRQPSTCGGRHPCANVLVPYSTPRLLVRNSSSMLTRKAPDLYDGPWYPDGREHGPRGKVGDVAGEVGVHIGEAKEARGEVAGEVGWKGPNGRGGAG